MSSGDIFTGRRALVTGGSAGIGAAVCHALLSQGAEVVSLSRDKGSLSHAAFAQHEVDLSDIRSTRTMSLDLAKQAPFDILINNAGVVRNTRLEDVADEEFELLVDLHLRAAVVLAQALTPGMRERGFGRIVNLSSRALVGMAGRTVYSATKAALVAMTRTWALELGPYGITVNAVAPGPTVTPMLVADIPAQSQKARDLAAALPMRRLGEPEDVARAVLFFADPRNSWVTGQNLFVCGGASVGTAIPI
ncbi:MULTISPECIES: SDR family NAD(P)-dependent oxidoreductase [unclassified Variovorax]|uniref:SDR family NAD(P)-dependent oxidoreductase n=1 Tax=unclassified Variovorax TaxID=663243 RepID=UPI003F4776A9